MVLYYFPVECPDYAKNMLIIVQEGNLDRYFVPEMETLIVVKKNHKWTKEPSFIFWKNEAKSLIRHKIT